MDQLFLEKKQRKHRILVAPLDWGLGHATRCIPIIRELLYQDCEVFLAGESAQEVLLKSEFPQLIFIPLKGYRIRYSKTGCGLSWQMIKQIPVIKKVIRYEKEWLIKTIKEHQLDAVISDNRYGLYNESVLSVLITHQLSIKTNWGEWSERLLQKKNFNLLNHFSECWIPDYEDIHNLAGILSHPQKKPDIPCQYIGWLSRIKKKNIAVEKNHLLLLLSGPEPQRSLFENIIIQQISHYNGTATIVRGLPNATTLIPSTNSLRFYNHLKADEMGVEMERAEFIIARSGYSTIMDIAALQKKSILIPTPGQTEQEYLAQYLSKKQFASWCTQKEFSIENSLAKARGFSYKFIYPGDENKLNVAVSNLLKKMEQFQT
ncbi:MAG: glycosyl transferase family 28 [Bacteroidetes bacterium]|nr:glycosyl transferase family 28 [Bacteroidota bacterium]MBS1932042.1 glycosyl transferase family 28 [Bacteroidota bacterium]